MAHPVRWLIFGTLVLHLAAGPAYFRVMNWIKALIIDVTVTIVIIIAVTTEMEWARWAVIIYTPFMLLLKLVALLGGSLTRKFKKNVPEAPPWAYHILYLINVAAPALVQWWLIAAQWAAIWLLSYLEFRRSSD